MPHKTGCDTPDNRNIQKHWNLGTGKNEVIYEAKVPLIVMNF